MPQPDTSLLLQRQSSLDNEPLRARYSPGGSRPLSFPFGHFVCLLAGTAYHTRSSLVKAMPCGGLAFLPFPINSTKPDSFCCVRFVQRYEIPYCVAKTNPCAIPSATFGSYGIVLSRNKITVVVAFVYLVLRQTFMDPSDLSTFK